MADEENPLGEGPFGVGPFGPLVATAAAAVAAFSFVAVTTVTPVNRTLFYQANIVPPPTAALDAAKAATTPDKWLIAWKGPPKYQPNRGPFAAHLVAEPAVVVDNINAATGITTGGRFSKTCFYQANVYALAPPVAAVVDVTIEKWQQPFSRAVPKPPTETGLYTPFTPSPQAQPELDWLQPWRRAAQGPPPVHTQPVLGFAAAPQVTPDEWMVPFRRAAQALPPVHTQPVLGYPAAEQPNLTTTLEWMQPFNRAVPQPHPAQSQPVFGYPYEAASNLTTTLEWMPAWQGPPRYKLALPGGQPFVPREATSENTPTGTGWELTIDGYGAFPRRPVAPVGGQPFVPREATVENTVATGWHQPFYKAVPPPRLNVSQPVYGYPYEGVDNSRNEWDWHVQWPGPPRRLLGLPGGQPFVAKQFVEDVHGPEKWLQAFRAPPRYWPVKVQALPFVPREATVDNTVATGWHQPLYKAVPVPKPVPTQPVFGYPYETQAIVVPYEQWWHQPLSRAAPRPAVHNRPYQPFVPREATVENTVTVEKWLQRWQGPPRYRPAKILAQPFVPAERTFENTATVDKWLPWWKGPPRYRPPKILAQPFVPREAVLENTQTPDKWHRDLSRPVAKRPVTHTQPGWHIEPPAVAFTPTILWYQPLSVAVPVPKPRPTQPFFGYPYIAGINTQNVTINITVSFDRMLRYVCKAEIADDSAEQAQQTDPWIVQAEAVTGVGGGGGGECDFDDAYQLSAFQTAFQVCEEGGGGGGGEPCDFDDAFQLTVFQSTAFQVCEGGGGGGGGGSGPVEQAEQTDPWAAASETTVAWGDAQEIPRSGCEGCGDE